MKRYIVYLEQQVEMPYKHPARLYESTELVNDRILFNYLVNSGSGTDGKAIGTYDTLEEARACFEAEKPKCRTYLDDGFYNDKLFHADLLWFEEEEYEIDEDGDINAYGWEMQDCYAEPYVIEKDDDTDYDFQ